MIIIYKLSKNIKIYTYLSLLFIVNFNLIMEYGANNNKY